MQKQFWHGHNTSSTSADCGSLFTWKVLIFSLKCVLSGNEGLNWLFFFIYQIHFRNTCWCKLWMTHINLTQIVSNCCAQVFVRFYCICTTKQEMSWRCITPLPTFFFFFVMSVKEFLLQNCSVFFFFFFIWILLLLFSQLILYWLKLTQRLNDRCFIGGKKWSDYPSKHTTLESNPYVWFTPIQ